MPLDVRIEQMTVHHISAVMAIDEQGYGDPWSATTWYKEMGDPDRLHLVAITDTELGGDNRADNGEGERVVGHAGLLYLAGMAHVSNVAVDPEYQHQGVATRLLIELLDRTRAHGSSAVTLEARAANKRAHRLYSRLGFQPLGITPDYYTKPSEDALVMSIRYLDEPEVAERIDRVRAALK
ncbi:MAG: ribosomal-protein-alanine N-acetyltransferase [Acidimicrobiaceae bacterium]|nr:ribosomal-protein-alanine N-acetyltransferase [Acidimicrobiaceae bacterium]MXW76730.1 ribosomal-protein-alanine N-acetyltransferase [Acidimicrobiaceae bacterium]MYA74356.1 ribosomal-protein-alanine N-acetyltransferase [Acidimicrobiaceae bacterium]MYC41863.1 ribosomal-protein-alanine N-acetyltransferase [Acidimicrobiaceae bacterium]MYD06693.1 ribosomal-protein-alanine N-acetyltransferase [Acidimicrobiaceae bacterium]